MKTMALEVLKGLLSLQVNIDQFERASDATFLFCNVYLLFKPGTSMKGKSLPLNNATMLLTQKEIQP
jgi:hypothetical protein